jgi:urea transporter
MIDKLLNTRVWYWIFAAAHTIMGVLIGVLNPNLLAEGAWGAGNVLGHDAFYERGLSLFGLSLSLMMIGNGLVFSGRAFHKIAAITGTTMAVVFVICAIYSSSQDYGTLAMWIPPFVLAGMLLVSAGRALRTAEAE